MQPEDLIPCPDCGADLCPSELTDDWECGDGGCLWTTANYGPCPRPTFAPWVRMDLDQGTDPESAIRVRYGGEVVAFMMPILARPYSSAATVNRLVAGALAAGENP